MFVLSAGIECSLYITFISLHFIPRYSMYTSTQISGCLTPVELKDLACQTVKSTLHVTEQHARGHENH